MSAQKIFLAAITVLFITCNAMCAYLEQDYETNNDRTEIRPPSRVHPRHERNEVTHLIDRVDIGRAYTSHNMTVFPLYLSHEEDSRQYVTLDDAIDRGFLKILEKGSGTVSEVEVENTSGHYIFMMAGEIIGGGKQTRVISKDALLRPHGGVITIPVYCVEQHRWSYTGAKKFSSEKSLAPSSIRYMTQNKAGQSKVWGEVDRLAKTTDTETSSGNFQAVYEDSGVRKRLAEYDSLKHMPRRTVGVVVAVHGRIIGAEIFCNEDLFDDLWPKILRSYSLDAINPIPMIEKRHRVPDMRVTRDQIQRFLNTVYTARYNEESGIDAGHLLNLARTISGKALIFRKAVIHLNLASSDFIILDR